MPLQSSGRPAAPMDGRSICKQKTPGAARPPGVIRPGELGQDIYGELHRRSGFRLILTGLATGSPTICCQRLWSLATNRSAKTQIEAENYCLGTPPPPPVLHKCSF